MSEIDTAAQESIAMARSRGLLGRAPSRGGTATAGIVLSDAALGTRDLGRYLFVLVNYLHAAGHDVYLSGNGELLASLATKRYARMLLETSQVRLLPERDQTQPFDVLLHDGSVGSVPDGTAKEVKLVRGRRLTQARHAYDVLFPYMLHPKYYATGEALNVGQLRNGQRTRRLLFAGNVSERYANPAINTKYGKLDRFRIVERLRADLSGDEMIVMSAAEADRREQTTCGPRFTLIDTSTGDRIPKHRWLATLGQSDFFLACPGVDMPLSHNLVEAMSVGAIPVTQCADYFDPPLRHGYECMAHAGHDVAAAVRTVLAMPDTEILTMRAHVIAHYERYLTPAAFERRVLNHAAPRLRLGLNFMPAV